MRTFLDAKAMAKSLRASLSERQVALSHSECLEIVAQQFALDDWNTLSAKIDAAPRAEPQPEPENGPYLQTAIPVLRIFSVEKAKEFYLGFLGFTWDWEHRFADNFPLYAQVSRSGIVLHLSEHHGDACPGSATMIMLRRGAQPSEGHPDGCDHRVRKVAGETLVQGAERLGPVPRDRAQVQAQGDRPQELHGEQG